MKEKSTRLNKQSNEFSAKSTKPLDISKMSNINRRKFLALLGASTAFAATACTDYRDKGEIISYNKKPENITFGEANYYASTYRDGSPILIKTREGRPIGILGNSDHPISKGKTSIEASAAILDLYDPERLKKPIKNNAESDWKTVDNDIIAALNNAKAQSKHIAIICNEIKSPTFAKVLSDFVGKYENVGIYPVSLFNNKNRKDAWKICYSGRSNYPKIHWDKASLIVAIEADILGAEANSHEIINDFAKRRNADIPENFNRLYAVEANMSLTGSNADYRIKLNPLATFDFLAAIYNEIIQKIAPMGFSAIGNYSIDSVISQHGLNRKIINTLINDLLGKQGEAIIYAGDKMPVAVHCIANAINDIISGEKLYDYSRESVSYFDALGCHGISSMIDELRSGDTAVAMLIDCNPEYFLPKDLAFADAFAKVPTKICISEKENESSMLCDYVLPMNHPFESWGDYHDISGIVNLRQPVIEPIYASRQPEAVLLNWLGSSNDYDNSIYHKYLKNYWQTEILKWANSPTSTQNLWFASLHDGFIEFSANPSSSGRFDSSILSKLKPLPNASGITVVLTKSHFISDGRYASNGWLQEIPHPVSKVIWDNYAAIAPATAKKLNLDYKDFKSDLAEITIGDRKITLPVLLQPGMCEDVVAIELGYGRSNAGTIGSNVGVNATHLMTKDADICTFMFSGASINKVNKKYKLYSSQEHHKLDDEFIKDFHRIRNIIQDGTVAQYIQNPNFIKDARIMTEEEIDKHSVNPPHKYDEVKWAMAIDLNKCVACARCVASCNVENNVPIVGKEECGNGREMHWMRIDRYYSGTDEEPIVSNMPMLCMHCDMAPCENVCPVVATTHSPDGLNQMTYNRCVGTRYCANNCPYKVRRFNFFDFRNWYASGYYEKDSLELLHNPEVTVRSRGVMEKCTFCIQRLMEGRQQATKQGETFTGKGIKTACQEACPADAIIFGNVNDPKSDISKAIKSNLGYKVLEIIGIKPNVTYMAKLRNTNAEDSL